MVVTKKVLIYARIKLYLKPPPISDLPAESKKLKREYGALIDQKMEIMKLWG